MATRIKTVEYPFPANNSSLALNTKYNFGGITIYIPENTSRTFRSVALIISARGSETTATSWGTITVGITLAAASESTLAMGTVVANSGEQQFQVWTRDITSYFVTNFGSGTSQTAACSIQISGVASISLSAKLIITYEYDDASQDTRVKTVRIPLESGLGALTASLVELGTNQVPNLDSFLPETSKTYRAIWFDIYFNEGAAATTDHALTVSLDSEGAYSLGTYEQGLNSACGCYFAWVRRYYNNSGSQQEPSGAFTTNATHAFKAAYVSAGDFRHIAVVLNVTYEYSHTNSTSFMKSLILGVPYMGFVAGTAEADADLSVKKFILEDANISMVQSGAMILFSSIDNSSINIKLGSQSGYRTYTSTTSLYCGSDFLIQRIDSGSAVGAALSPARGENSLSLYIYLSAAGVGHSGFSSMVFFNYTCDKGNGEGQHSNTCLWLVEPMGSNATQTRLLAAAQKVFIPETNYYLMGCSVLFFGMIYGAGTTPSSAGIAVQAEAGAGVEDGDGWPAWMRVLFAYEGETGWYPCISPVMCNIKKYPNDINNGFDIKGSYRWLLQAGTSTHWSAFLVTNHHSYSYTISGTISGYTGDGSGITVDIFRADNREYIGTTTTSAGGTWTFTWYDNTINYFAVSRQDDTHCGRSANGTAV